MMAIETPLPYFQPHELTNFCNSICFFAEALGGYLPCRMTMWASLSLVYTCTEDYINFQAYPCL